MTQLDLLNWQPESLEGKASHERPFKFDQPDSSQTHTIHAHSHITINGLIKSICQGPGRIIAVLRVV